MKKTLLRANPVHKTKKRSKRRGMSEKEIATEVKRFRGSKAARRFTRKASTKKLQREWKHVYKSTKHRGYSTARAIKQASGVVTKTVKRIKILVRNPRTQWLVEAYHSARHQFFYLTMDDRLTTDRRKAQVLGSEIAALARAKWARSRVPSSIEWLRPVHA